MRRTFLLWALMFGCGQAPEDEVPPAGRPVGRTCAETPQCAEGLQCLAQPDTDEWCDQESYCTLACTADPECVEALGEGHICVDWCGASLCFEGSSS